MQSSTFGSYALPVATLIVVVGLVALAPVLHDPSVIACRPGNAAGVQQITSGGCRMIRLSR
jgi:hypothetical protein